MQGLPVYFLVISVDFCLCLLWLVKRAEARGFKRNHALDLALALMFGGFLGARLFHVFFEEPRYYFEDPTRVFYIWLGGFVWYGGAIVGAASSVWLARKRGLSLPAWLDVFAPIAAFGYGFGRLSCVIEGCCYGAFCELADGSRFRYPTQGFAVVWEFAVMTLLLRLERRVAT